MIRQVINKIDVFRKVFCGVFLIMTFFSCLIFPTKSLAAGKTLYMVPSATNIETGMQLEVKVYIDTDGAPVNSVGFDIDFPTEILEGSEPNMAGSVFPLSPELSSTRVDTGLTKAGGFTGLGLVATLKYVGKSAGSATININNFQALFGPKGLEVAGFVVSPTTITVYGEGLMPVEKNTTAPAEATAVDPNAEKIVPVESSLNKTPQVATPPKTITNPTETKGSQSQVVGNTGATPEKPITKAPTAKDVMVKGFSFKNPIYYGLLPTFLLLVLVMNLGIKLYFTEKRRHLDMVHLFDTQLGTISSLESKLDMADSKIEGGKEKIIQEFEEVKAQMAAEEKTKLT